MGVSKKRLRSNDRENSIETIRNAKKVAMNRAKRSLTPDRFLNPPSKVGCSKCRYKGCRKCRGYTLKELKEWESQNKDLDTQTCAKQYVERTEAEVTARKGDLGKRSCIDKARGRKGKQCSPNKVDSVRKSPKHSDSKVHDIVEEQSTPVLNKDHRARTLETPDVRSGDENHKETCASANQMNEKTQKKDIEKQLECSGVLKPVMTQNNDEAWWNPLDEDIVHRVKSCLHVSYSESAYLPSCREGQVHGISEWLNTCIENRQGDALYLSGVPGTGKTLAAHALVRNAVTDIVKHGEFGPPIAISINCMRLQTAASVLRRIIDGFKTAALKTVSGQLDSEPIIQVPEDDRGIVLSGPWEDLSPAEHLRKIVTAPILTKEEISTSSTKRRRSSVSEVDLVKQTGLIFLILDEIDGMLEGKHCEEILGSLISLAASKGSRLVMIGISNSIDLMQQLVRPGAILHRYNMKPRNIIFPTYLRDQVSKLIQERLDTLPGPVFDRKAVEFCARKIANGTGDMRRALEASSIAVDFAVKEALKSDQDTQSSGLKMVTMRHMAVALSKVSGGIGTSNEHVCAIKKLPVPQQLIMCAVSAMVGETLKARGLKNESQFNGHLMGMKPSQSLISLPTYRHSGSETSIKSASHVVTLSEIEQNHRKLCSKIGVDTYSSSEFTTAIEVLSTLGLIQLTKANSKTDLKRCRVQLKIGEDDVWMALADVPILNSILTKKA